MQKQEIRTTQGFKLGPRFFDIYSNDMSSIIFNDESILYADDTTVAYVGNLAVTLVSWKIELTKYCKNSLIGVDLINLLLMQVSVNKCFSQTNM